MEKVKKIALFMPSFQLGGGEKTFVKLANCFVAAGFAVDFVVCHKRGIFLEQLSSEVRIISARARVRFVLPALVWYLSKAQPDYFLSGSDFPNYLSLLAGMLAGKKTKVIVAQHCFYDMESKRLGLHGRLSPWLMKKLYPKAHRVVAVSEAIRSFLLSAGIADDKITTIYNPIDPEELATLSTEEPAVRIDSPYIIYVGRLTPVKNIPFIIDSYRKMNLRNALKLVIVGSGEDEQYLREYVEREGLASDVVFTGQTNPFPYMRQAELLVLGSFSESFSLVVAEAICLGKTVVSTPTGGARELLSEGKYGYISQSFTDSDAFARILEGALERPVDPALLKERSLSFHPGRIIEQYIRLMS